MKRRLRPYANAAPDMPMSQKIEMLMHKIHTGKGFYPPDYRNVIEECIKRGLIKRGRINIGRLVRRNTLIALVPAPVVEEEHVHVPYANRNADLDEAGLRRRKSV